MEDERDQVFARGRGQSRNAEFEVAHGLGWDSKFDASPVIAYIFVVNFEARIAPLLGDPASSDISTQIGYIFGSSYNSASSRGNLRGQGSFSFLLSLARSA